jgi:N-acetylglucosamine-6-phosphate deacetylase
MRALRGTIITPEELIPRGVVAYEGGYITYVGPPPGPEVEEVLDLGDGYIAPGLIDLHLHGGGGYDVLRGDSATLDALSRWLAEGGVTAFLPTAATTSRERLQSVAEAVREAAEGGAAGAEVLGLYMEGPYINPERRGAQNPEYIRPPSLEEIDEIMEASGGLLRVVALAPELKGALELVEHLAHLGVVPSAAHTDAAYEEAIRAVEHGLRHFTHLYNAMRGFHHREPGVVGAALTSEATAELIADGVHLHPTAIRLALAMKGAERMALISDAAPPAGLPDGEYSFGEIEIVVEDGICRLPSGELAGGSIRLCDAVGYLVKELHIQLREAIQMASRTPAEVLGLGHRKGALKRGFDADIVALDRRLRPLMTIVGGRIVYRRH